ncbi:hypothetical protein J6590_107257, partial [Homalodisca vitripennis]
MNHIWFISKVYEAYKISVIETINITDHRRTTNCTTGTRTAHTPNLFSGRIQLCVAGASTGSQELTALCGDQRDDTAFRLFMSKHESSFNAGFCI